MSPERWRQVREVFDAALACHEMDRVGLLEKACAGDRALRAEVDAMLAADGAAGAFGDTPVFASADTEPRLAPGVMVGPYRIGERIGVGGMGEVYRAHDPRLDRAVAVKVLYPVPDADPDSREQLLREARSAAALNHPHVCTIHDVGEADGHAYIAMELIRGQTLDLLIPDGGLPVAEVTRYGLQIADAMAHAHDRGVLHGDLKPANVMVSEAGVPKILDFGLARILTTVETTTNARASDPKAASPLLGTAGYISPEQARGRPTDERSDVFSCGVMLYEMTTGRSPFAGATSAAVLDAVLHAEPEPVAKLRRDLPAALSATVQKALAKDPAQRHQSMSELAADLRRLQPRAAAVGAPVLAAGAAAALGFVAIALWLVPGTEEVETAPAHIVQVTTLPGLEYAPTWSPDGRSLAYASDAAGNLDIYVQEIGTGHAVRLTDSDADDAQPAWSPDGSRIAFVSARSRPDHRLSVLIGMSRVQSILALRHGGVWVMPATGGAARAIADDAYDPAWSPDGRQIVYAAVRDRGWGLWIRDADAASEPHRLQVTAARPGFPALRPDLPTIQPAWSPDGGWIAFTVGRDPGLRVFAVRSAGGDASQLTDIGANAQMPAWSPDGRWLYFSSERSGRINLYRARFEDGRLGPARQVTTGSGADVQARLDPPGARVAYSSVRHVMDLWEYDLASGHADRLTSETTLEDNPSPSRDGRWLAFTSNRLNGYHLWLLDRRTGALTQVTSVPNSGLQVSARWSWDGRFLLYSRPFDEAGRGLWQYEVATGAARRIHEGGADDGDFCLSSDGALVIVAHRAGGLVRVDLASSAKEVLGHLSPDTRSDLACSPDGRSVAFHVQHDDDRDIWLMPLSGGAPRQLTSGDDEDSHPAWSPDGRLVYFVRNHQDVYAVPPAGGEAKPVTHYRSLGITLDYPAASGDGKKIVFTRMENPGDIYILENPRP